MAIMVMDTALNKTTFAVALFAILSASTYAGEWQFQPKLLIDETYSNNVNLSLSDEISSLVSQTGIELETVFSSKKLAFSLSSTSLYAMYSHDHDTDNDYHTLDSNFRLKLAPNGLALIGSAAISNQSRNSSSNALADIVSGDTVRIENYASGLEYIINNRTLVLNSNIQYQTIASEDNIGERDGFSASLTSKNSSSARNIYWDASSNFSDYTNQGRDGKTFRGEIKIGLITRYKMTPFLRYYDETNEGASSNNNSSTESDSYGAGFRWLVTQKFHFDVSYNAPTGNQLDIDGKEQDDYTAATIRWEPNQRTRLEASYGQRFYGESYNLDFTHRSRKLTNRITYNEDVRTFTRTNYEATVLGDYWCPPGGSFNESSCFVTDNSTINIDDYQLIPLNDFTLVEDEDLSLHKEFSWSSRLELSRTSFNFLLSRIRRENLNTRVEDEDKRATFGILRKVSGNSTLQLSFGYSDNHYSLDQEEERQDRYRRYSVEYDKSLNSRLTVKIGLSRVNRGSTAQSLNYEEDRIYLKVSKGF
jgi:uncharacterized protein (PEP-CTERM system associated)